MSFVSFAEYLQVYPDGIRHIRADKRVNEWKTPGKKTIVRCAVNQRQVVIALTGGELVYFEMDPVCWRTYFYLALSPECSSTVWMSLSIKISLSFFSLGSWMNTRRGRRCQQMWCAWVWQMCLRVNNVPVSWLLAWWTIQSVSSPWIHP